MVAVGSDTAAVSGTTAASAATTGALGVAVASLSLISAGCYRSTTNILTAVRSWEKMWKRERQQVPPKQVQPLPVRQQFP